MAVPRYQRILLKLSGEALAEAGGSGINPAIVAALASEVATVTSEDVQVAIVIGGGNIFRGLKASEGGMDRATADYMGMLATVINALALQDALERREIPTRVLTAITMQAVAEPYIRRRAVRHLEKGRVVILAAGTGNPYFTTDTTAALRAVELGCELLLKATDVDGIYSADPSRDPNAQRFTSISYMEFINRGLAVMDTTAITLCMENQVPIQVFDVRRSGNILRVVHGEPIGTRVEATAVQTAGR